jgi:hypothetical protein
MLDCLIIGGGPPASLLLYISVATTGAPALSMRAKSCRSDSGKSQLSRVQRHRWTRAAAPAGRTGGALRGRSVTGEISTLNRRSDGLFVARGRSGLEVHARFVLLRPGSSTMSVERG